MRGCENYLSSDLVTIGGDDKGLESCQGGKHKSGSVNLPPPSYDMSCLWPPSGTLCSDVGDGAGGGGKSEGAMDDLRFLLIRL